MLVQHGPGPLSPAVPTTKSGHVEALRGGRHGEAGCWGGGVRELCREAEGVCRGEPERFDAAS